MSQKLKAGDWILYLNRMTDAHIEDISPVGFAETRGALEAFVKQQSVPLYRDGQYMKTFKKGGPLEWFNPPDGWSHNYLRWFPREPLLTHVSELESQES